MSNEKSYQKKGMLKCNIFTKMQKRDKMYKQEHEGIFFHLNLA